MEKFDWKSTINIDIVNLKALGFWPKGDKGYKFNLYSIWTAISFIGIIFAYNFCKAINIFFVLDDLNAIVSTVFITLSELLGMVKAYYLIQNMGKLKQLMITVNSKIFQPRNQTQIQLIKPNLKFWKLVYILLWTMSGGAIFFWATFPILDKSIKDYRLPFLAWYPFDTTVSPNYEITYIYQIIGVTFVATSTLGVDTLIAGLLMYAASQIDILCDDLRQISAQNFTKKLLKCVKHHKEILRFTENANQFFNWIVFFQFFISAVSIGITLYQMTVVVPLSSEFISALSFELAMIVEIFMYCWFGNEVQEKSKNIPYAIFESDWTNASIEAKKYMKFFVLKCQHPIKVSALNLFYLSLQTYMKILQTSWSYFALLHQVSSRK